MTSVALSAGDDEVVRIAIGQSPRRNLLPHGPEAGEAGITLPLLYHSRSWEGASDR
jgi:hypothetical protein